MGTRVLNLKSVALTVFELLVFNAQKVRGHVTLAMSPFRKNLRDHVRTVTADHVFTVRFSTSLLVTSYKKYSINISIR